ncbi:MAG: hypothetical protein AABW51_01445 [Nanoarchaeota archaeon]
MDELPIIPSEYVLRSITYSQYFPDKHQVTKKKTTRDKKVLTSLESALREPMEHLHLFAVDPKEERYTLLLNSGRNQIGMQVFRTSLIVVNNEGYEPKTNNLYNILDSLPKSEIQRISYPKLKFSRAQKVPQYNLKY